MRIRNPIASLHGPAYRIIHPGTHSYQGDCLAHFRADHQHLCALDELPQTRNLLRAFLQTKRMTQTE